VKSNSLDFKNVALFGNNSLISTTIASEIISNNVSEFNFFCPNTSDFSILNDHSNCKVFNFNELAEINSFIKENVLVPYDGLVFNMGMGGVRPVKLNSPDFVSEMFHKNVFIFFEIIRVLLKQKMINPGASIVVLSSVASICGLKSKSVYSASKAALDAAIRGMAAELSDKKIRINSIQKGWVSSDMQQDFIQDNMSLDGGSDLGRQLLGVIEPEEIARLTTFLLSDSVKTMTGTNILLDGGYTL